MGPRKYDLSNERRKQVKLIRGSLQARMLMWQVARAKDEIATIERLISEKEDEFSKKHKELPPEQVKAFREFVREKLEKIHRTFSSVAVVAVTYGETAAGDIFLPSVVESLRSVTFKLASLIKKNPELAKAMFPVKEKPPKEIIKEAKMFFDEFGEEIIEKIPERLQSRKAVIEEIMKHPERLGLLTSILWT